MLWSTLNTTAQSILLNFQGLIFECVQQTNPDKNYYAKQGDDFHYLTQILFPLMNGIISFDSDPQQNARGVCDKLGFKEYAHFIPLCHGFDLNAISA